MKRAGEQFPRKLWRRGALPSIAALCLAFLLTVTVFAGNVNIYDQAHVLNSSQISNAASSLKYPLSVYTVSDSFSSTSAFDKRAATHVTSNLIVISISTYLQHVVIQYGSNVSLSNSDTNNAVNAFISSYKSNHDYTSATISSINSLSSTLGSSRSSNSSGEHGGGFNILGTCLVGLVILGVLALLFFLLRRNRNRPQYTNQNYGQPTHQTISNPIHQTISNPIHQTISKIKV